MCCLTATEYISQNEDYNYKRLYFAIEGCFMIIVRRRCLAGSDCLIHTNKELRIVLLGF